MVDIYKEDDGPLKTSGADLHVVKCFHSSP